MSAVGSDVLTPAGMRAKAPGRDLTAQGPTAVRSDPVLAWCLLAAFVVFVVAATMLTAPLLPGDEYAFFASGAYSDRLDQIRLLDPWLQPVTNFLFFGLVHFVHVLAGGSFVPVFRIVHAAELILAAFVLHRTALAVLGPRDAFASALLFLLLPSSMYVFTVMPEVEVVLATACIAYSMVVVLPRQPVVASLSAGVLIGIALLMKPHAVAILAAVLLVVMIAPWFVNEPRRVAAAGRAGVLVLVASYLTVIVLWRLSHASWAFNPLLPLGLGFYGAMVGGAVGGLSIGSKLLDALMYAAAHLGIAALVFAPALVWCGTTVAVALRSHRPQASRAQQGAPTASAWLLALFASAMLLSHVAMTAWFSAGVGSTNEGEALRLHGRYLGPVLSLLPLVYLVALRRQTRREMILSAALGIVGVVAFVGLIRPTFKIFPWDYPLLFAFFSTPNRFKIDFEGSVAVIGAVLPWIVLATYAAAIASKKFSRKALLAQLGLVLLAGNVQTYAWVHRQSVNNRPLANEAKALAALVGEGQFGKGIVVTASRYGDGATLLFGLANAPRVLFKEAASTITAQDVAGASWIVLADPYRIDFDAPQSMALGALRFFPLDSSAAISQRDKRFLPVGETRAVSLATGQLAPARLVGFNAQEVWGAWTAGLATVELPFQVQGTIKLQLGGWALAENLGKPLRIMIGDEEVDVPLKTTGALYDVTLQVQRPTDRIRLDSATLETAPNHWLGVAVGSIAVTRVAP